MQAEEIEQKKLLQLVKNTAREEAWRAIDEHVEEFRHRRKLRKLSETTRKDPLPRR